MRITAIDTFAVGPAGGWPGYAQEQFHPQRRNRPCLGTGQLPGCWSGSLPGRPAQRWNERHSGGACRNNENSRTRQRRKHSACEYHRHQRERSQVPGIMAAKSATRILAIDPVTPASRVNSTRDLFTSASATSLVRMTMGTQGSAPARMAPGR